VHGSLVLISLSSPRVVQVCKGKLMGIIEVDLFSEDVDSLDHPEVVKFRRLLEEVADDYNCSLASFHIDQGTVSFSFDNDELDAEILRILQEL
jgi:hypothetical protein